MMRRFHPTHRAPCGCQMNTDHASRRGTVVVCVLACMLVAASLAAATTHAALRWRRSIRIDHQMRQTELLLDAGILRAAKQLRANPDYQGETWRLSVDSIGFESTAVEIRVNPDDDPQGRRVDVVASIGATGDSPKRTNQSQTRRSHTYSTQVAAE